jgi:hypothetical protein
MCAFLTLLLWQSATPQQPNGGATTGLDQYLSLDFLKQIFTDRQTSAVSTVSDPAKLSQLYGLLYDAGEKQRAFVTTLEQYSSAVDAHSPVLSLDYKINDVGTAADAMNRALSRLLLTFKSLGADLSIRDPELEHDLTIYTEARGDLLNAILNRHDLSGATPVQLHRLVAAANQNGKLFDQALEVLQKRIKSRTKELGQGSGF